MKEQKEKDLNPKIELSVSIDPNQINCLLTCEGAAEYLTLSKSTLDVWRCKGRQDIPFVRLGRAIRYRKTDLDAYLARKVVGMPTS